MFKKILAVLVMLYAAVAMAAVDVNKATAAELDGVKGIGPGTSKMIMDERKKAEFKSWDDFVQRVKGVGDKRAENLSEAGLRVNGQTFKKTATAKKDEKKAAEAKPAASAKPAAPAAPAASAKAAASAKK